MYAANDMPDLKIIIRINVIYFFLTPEFYKNNIDASSEGLTCK